MSSDLLPTFYIAAAGFVAAGLLSSFYQLVTAKPCRFDLGTDGMVAALGSIVLCMFAGPVILLRNALRGRRLERRPLYWLAASAAVATCWSLCSGVVVMQFVLALRSSIA